MKGSDLLQFSLDNLRRTRLRTFLTTLGVIIGIGALVAMVSFGTGMQRNITEAFTANDLFTTIRVLPVRMDIEQVMAGNLDGAMSGMQKRTRALNDTAIALIAARRARCARNGVHELRRLRQKPRAKRGLAGTRRSRHHDKERPMLPHISHAIYSSRTQQAPQCVVTLC